jgi:hypothetical protein
LINESGFTVYADELSALCEAGMGGKGCFSFHAVSPEVHRAGHTIGLGDHRKTVNPEGRGLSRKRAKISGRTNPKYARTNTVFSDYGFFPIYNLRHVFCTRLSWVAPDAVVQHAMRHSSPETKRFYQLGLAHQVREHLERVNRKTEQERDSLQIRDSGSCQEQVEQIEVRN